MKNSTAHPFISHTDFIPSHITEYQKYDLI